MRNSFLLVLVVIYLAVVLADQSTSEGKPKLDDLKVDVKKKPRVCLRKLQANDVLTMHAVGTLRDTGEVFESTRLLNKPLMVQYVEGALITGVYDGIIQMCAGEIRYLEIPSSLAFGEKGYTSPNTGVLVKGDSDVDFEIEMLDISEEPDGGALYDQLMTEITGIDATTKLEDGLSDESNITDKERSEQKRGIPIEPLQEILFMKTKEESQNKQLSFAVDDNLIHILTDGLKMADKNGDSHLDRGEFSNSILFNQDPATIKELESKYNVKTTNSLKREAEERRVKESETKKEETDTNKKIEL